MSKPHASRTKKRASVPSDKVPVFALIFAEQKAALEELGHKRERSLGFLVREAITDYLAKARPDAG